MSAQQTASTYWHLFRLLTMPARYQYWLLIISIGCALLGALGALVGYWWLWIPAAALFSVWFFTAGLIIHGQLLVVASNRSLSLLRSIRQRALVIHVATLSLVSVLPALLQIVKGEALIDSLVVSWVLCSLMSFGFIACLVWSPQFGLLLLWVVGWGFYKLVWPLGVPLWLYFGVAVIAWWLYARWWLRWLPAKRIDNPFMMASWGTMQVRVQISFVGQGLFIGVKRRLLRLIVAREPSPRDLYASLLTGGAVSLPGRLVNWLTFTVILLLVWLLAYVFGAMGFFNDMIGIVGPIMFWVFLSGAGMGFIMWMYHNLARAWLYFPGSRSTLFRAIEWRYLQCLLMDSTLFCLLGAVVFKAVFPDVYEEISLLLWLPLYFLLVLGFWWFFFQCGWLVYCYTHGSVQWWSFAVFLGVIGQLVLAGSCWWLVEQGVQAPETLAFMLVIVFLALGLVLRPLAQVASRRMSFARRPH